MKRVMPEVRGGVRKGLPAPALMLLLPPAVGDNVALPGGNDGRAPAAAACCDAVVEPGESGGDAPARRAGSCVLLEAAWVGSSLLLLMS